MRTQRNIPKAFIGFLIASFLIWLLITFSKEYNTTITFPVTYVNIPQNKLLQSVPVKQLNIFIKGSGFKILKTKILTPNLKLDVSNLQRKQKSKFYLLPFSQQSKIANQIATGLQIKQFELDTIFLNIGVLTSKKIKLKANTDITYHIGYDLLDDISIKPDSIVVSGTKMQLDSIKQIELSKLTLKDVKSNFSESVKIVKPKGVNNLKFSTSFAEISGKVDKFTEGKLEIPFLVKNLPNNTNLTTLSESVEISYVVALSNFSKVNINSFKVECDFLTSQDNNLSYLIPKLVTKPSFIKSYKIVPLKIDFLIQK
ncbi:hypothetical protein [Polaribacter porphyrae]|uniref:YbbR-like domain-containing protein n=1 Tax=Polaribacter porphyrae TaxID=1137780 RepID=A0A2S7WM08_9FLAO|nr:hypothetical protein [Polaribacter porphyrae]PQJ78496.1 hypothetical protein BTO18_04520 [Polaribacter porphyrae]